MRKFLEYLDARLGEASTWATLSAMLALVHVELPADVWQLVTLIAAIASAVLGVLLKEGSNTGVAKAALDAIEAAQRATPPGSKP